MNNSKLVAAPLGRALASASVAGLMLLSGPLVAAASTAPIWSVQTTVNPDTYNDMTSVSCAGSVCVAVGWYEDYNGPLIDSVPVVELWNGTDWAIQATPTPVGAIGSTFTAVNCTWAKACTLIGWWADSSGSIWPLVERWNGTTWGLQVPAIPVGATSASLGAISCPKSTTGSACEAVGEYSSPSGDGILAEHWDGTAWTIQSIPDPSGSTLSGVSCSSPTACTAVGTLVERWNGSSWSIQASPRGGLTAVSCPTLTACTAVGGAGLGGRSSSGAIRGPYSEQWNGTTWALKPTPVLGRVQFHSGSFSAVSCTSPTSCFAVGGSGYSPMVDHWNGSSWQFSPGVLFPPSAGLAWFNGVACTAATTCTAVGQYAPDPDEGYINSFAERYS